MEICNVNISVLIPTMNRPDSLKKTVESYMNAHFRPRQIVVVDQSKNKSDREENCRIMDEYRNVIDVEYVFQSVPSLTVARNNALRYATEDIVVFSDDDIEIYNDTLKNISLIMADESIAMIAGIDDLSAHNSSFVGFLLGTRSFVNRKIGHVTRSILGRYPDSVTTRTKTQWAMGYFFAVKRSLIFEWQLQFDEKLTSYAYAEDLDFSYSYYKRAVSAGLECVLDPTVHVKHLVSKEYRIQSKQATKMFVENRLYLSYKHQMGIGSRIAMGWCNFWKYIERVIKKQAADDLKESIECARKHKKEIATGCFTYNKD